MFNLPMSMSPINIFMFQTYKEKHQQYSVSTPCIALGTGHGCQLENSHHRVQLLLIFDLRLGSADKFLWILMTMYGTGVIQIHEIQRLLTFDIIRKISTFDDNGAAVLLNPFKLN